MKKKKAKYTLVTKAIGSMLKKVSKCMLHILLFYVKNKMYKTIFSRT